MANEEVQIREIREMMIKLTSDVGEIKGAIRILNDVKEDAKEAEKIAIRAESKADAANTRLDKIEDNIRWLWRTVGGAVLLAIIGFLLKGGLTVG